MRGGVAVFEKIIKERIELLKIQIKEVEEHLNVGNDFMVFYWQNEIEKYEYAIDVLNGVLNLVLS